MPERSSGRAHPRMFDNLEPREKSPANKRVLDRWVSELSSSPNGLEAGRLSHLIAATVGVAVLQQAVDLSGKPLFLLKGGTYLQYRLPGGSRATRDVDGLIRGDLFAFFSALDAVLSEDWGAITFQRTPAEEFEIPGKVLRPRRFHLKLLIRGEVWRRIKVEVSPDEAGAGDHYEELAPARLHYFGLPTPDRLLGIAVQFQVAQKVHAVTDPHDPPDVLNERARDLPDLLLLKRLIDLEGLPTNDDLRVACEAVFESRAAEAEQLGTEPRRWPPAVVPHSGWETDYVAAADEAGITLSLADAVDEVNMWIQEIARAQ